MRVTSLTLLLLAVGAFVGVGCCPCSTCVSYEEPGWNCWGCTTYEEPEWHPWACEPFEEPDWICWACRAYKEPNWCCLCSCGRHHEESAYSGEFDNGPDATSYDMIINSRDPISGRPVSNSVGTRAFDGKTIGFSSTTSARTWDTLSSNQKREKLAGAMR